MTAPAEVLGLTLAELTARLVQEGIPAYRARQVFEWIYKKHALAYDEMTSLPRELRDYLVRLLPFPAVRERVRRVSSDGTVKFLYELRDRETIEAVIIPTSRRNTLCISSQAGCRFGCKFCASGLKGLERNLTAGEIVGEVLHSRRAFPQGMVSHIVFMGTGEPFDNYEHVLRAVRLLNAKEGFNIAARRITISTCGVVPGIERFAKEGLQVELSVSLHASNNELRASLMPVNQKYPLDVLMNACRQFARDTGRQVTFEYILIKDRTCTPQCAEQLAVLMQGWLSKVNLIPCNPVSEYGNQAPSRAEVSDFRRRLESRRVVCTVRASRGQDVAAACGQLRLQAS